MEAAKTTGVIRRIDDLGRIVIPKEFRRAMRIREGEPMEMNLRGDQLIVTKYDPVLPVRAAISTLEAAVKDEMTLKCRDELLEKIQEIAAVVEREKEA